jgi:cytochrome c oxidase subunit 2
MNHHLSAFFGAVAAWLCLAPIAFAREPLSMPSTLGPAVAPAYHIVSPSIFLIWFAGGIFLAAGAFLAFTPFKVRTRKSDQSSGSAQVYQSTEIDLAWTLIPVLVLVLFLI